MIAGRPIPLSSMPAISPRSGTEKLHCGWLQLATVRPHPHWQVRPWLTSSTVVAEKPAVAKKSANAMHAANARMLAGSRVTISLTPARGRRRDLFLTAAERLRDCDPLAHVGPQRDDGAEHHHQRSRP